ncbi:hypothetical protein HRbin01_01455 [archaeon HR01]|nr:hypothetical protein HRbin01_01455 [archaeon HR01]
MAREVVGSLIIGIIVGVLFAFLFTHIFRKIHQKLFVDAFTLGIVIMVYGLAEQFGGNGVVSVFAFGLVLGNMQQINQALNGSGLLSESRTRGFQNPLFSGFADKKFHAQIAFLMKTYFFALLGMMFHLPNILMFLLSIAIVALLLLARYLMIYVASFGAKITRKERILMTLLCSRGLAAAVLASLTYQLPITDTIRVVTIQVIMITAIISSLIPLVVKREWDGRI